MFEEAEESSVFTKCIENEASPIVTIDFLRIILNFNYLHSFIIQFLKFGKFD